MQPESTPDFVVATYEEIRTRFGLGGTDQARIKAKRRKWEIEARNHPGAVARVRVPRTEWDAAGDPEERSRGADRERSRGSVIPFAPDQSRSFKPLADAVEAFREAGMRLRAERDAALTALAEAREKTARAEGEAVALREAVARADAARQAAEARAARDGARADQEAAARRAAEIELGRWAAGGPLSRAIRAFRGRRP